MTITSYAQNFEDVILWRALKHVEHGFYIDVGAQDPIIDSVSLAFYERGWRGVHIEPTPTYAAKIRDARPDEDVVQAAVGVEEGSLTFYQIPDTGLSTGDSSLASEHEGIGYAVQTIEVPSIRLSSVLDLYSSKDIHWLKIDVEGMESFVLDSWFPSLVRPWIVVVESTKPLSSVIASDNWDSKLVDLGYEFVYFDGLNRFYVSCLHPELKSSFGAGPNVFDDFILSGLASAPFCRRLTAEINSKQEQLRSKEEQLRSKEEKLEASIRDIRRLEAEIVALESSHSELQYERIRLQSRVEAQDILVRELDQKLSQIYQSASWRFTAPLRLTRRIMRRLVSRV